LHISKREESGSFMKSERNEAYDVKKRPLKIYVPPGMVDYGSVTKITGAPKVVSGPDSTSHRKGSCL
jgi:hypothetical protein